MPNRSLDEMLLDTCDVERYVAGQGSIGDATKTFSTHLTNVRCRLVYKHQQIADESTGFTVMTLHTMIMPAGTDIQQEDQIVNITTDIPSDGTYKVESVLPRRLFGEPHSLSLTLEIV